MRTFKFFWNTHKWLGIAASALLALTSVTGFLLLVKKDFAWLQPPTIRGEEGMMADFVPLSEVLAAVLAQGHPDFASEDDIDRIDTRPGRRVHKVRSRHRHAEIQVCAVTGAVLSIDVRRSDLIESLHDGSFFGDAVHGWVMPATSVVLLFMVFSGLWLWLEPLARKRRRKKRRAEAAGAG